MNDKSDIVQQFRQTKCYWWLRHAVELIAVGILDAAIMAFFYLLGIFLLVYMTIGFRVTIVLPFLMVSTITGWHASDWHLVEGWLNAGLCGKLVFIFYFVSPLFSVTMIWGTYHENN